MRLSETIKQVCAPPIPIIWKAGSQYTGTYGPLLDLCQGAPADPPSQPLRQSLLDVSSDRASSQYSTIRGLPALRVALALEMKAVYGPDIEVTGQDVSLTAGCNLAFYATMMALAEQGDEVILPVPWYWNHQMTLQMQGVTVVPLPVDMTTSFIPSPSVCELLITPRTRAIALVSPNNPTGATCTPDVLRAFAELARKHDIALVVDETYRDFVADRPHDLFSPTPNEEWHWRDHFIHLFSFSKSYAVPGYRLGAIVAAPNVLQQIDAVLDCIQISPPSLLQLALIPILSSLRPLIASASTILQNRRTHFQGILPPRWKIGSIGAYFAFVRHPFIDQTSEEVCEALARQMGVMVLPGSAFCMTGRGGAGGSRYERWVRVAVANVNEAQLTQAVERLVKFETICGWKLAVE